MEESTQPLNAPRLLAAPSVPLTEMAGHRPFTLVNISALETELARHPDRLFVDNLLDGMLHGFRIGYNGPRDSLISPNLRSALDNPTIVHEYLSKECERGHTAGPFSNPPCMPFRSAGIGVVPKKSGGHRLIVHLSAPAGDSINDGISGDEYSLEYVTVDDVVAHVVKQGPGALLYKVDIQHAFRNVPVHPDDWPLLGMVWDGVYYFDKVLPFGLRSSPAIFNRLAEALCWILRFEYSLPALEHYLDDFIGVSPPSHHVATSSAAMHKATLMTVFDNLGVPMAVGEDKNVGPTTVMTVLGIEVDSVAQVCRLPDEKLHSILDLLEVWSTRTTCTKKELLSLIGSLSFAAKVVPPGRTFIRRLLDLSCSASALSDVLVLDDEARLDIQWWVSFIQDWNGRSFFHDITWTKSPDLELYTDASDLGFGGYFCGRWFLGSWPDPLVSEPIMVRELYPIALCCLLWGKEWSGKKLLFHCDNEAAVLAWKKGACRNRNAMSLIRGMLGIAARNNFILYIQHIAGTNNSIADALSRMQVARFRQLAPAADPCPTSPPQLDVSNWSGRLAFW